MTRIWYLSEIFEDLVWGFLLSFPSSPSPSLPSPVAAAGAHVCVCFTSDYTSFVKRVTRLVQIYLSVKNVELEIRPFTDDDEALDVRGQPLMSSSSAPSRPTSSQPQSATANNVSDNAEDHLQLTSPVDDNTEQAPARRKTRKKRRSSGKSEDTGENTTLEQDSKGFPTFKLCYKIVFLLYIFYTIIIIGE